MKNTLLSKLLLSLITFFLWGQTLKVSATQLSGVCTINPSQPASLTNFKNFVSATRYLTSDSTRTDGGPSNSAPYGVNGSVIFQVASGTYAERFILDGRKVPGLSATNRIVFDGGSASPVITANIAHAVVLLNQCKYVTLRNLTINNTNTTNPSGIFIYGSGTILKGGTGCAIKQCKINLLIKNIGTGNAIALTDSNNQLGFSQQWADSIEIDSNIITGGAYGITVYGGVSNLYNKQFKVRNNTITNVRYGILFYRVNNGIDLLYNTISNTGDEGPTSTSEDMVKFSTCNTANAEGHRIIGNKFDANYRALNMEYGNGDSLSPALIYNNMIRSRVSGIMVGQPSNVKNYFRIYHNTIYIYTTMPYAYYTGNPFYHISSNTQGSILCKNNIFAVADAGGDTTLSIAASIENDTTSIYNYNLYYNPSGGGGKIFMRKSIAYKANNMLVKKIAGDSSIIAKPSFLSNTDLHLNHGCQFKGVDLSSEIPFDIDGEPRSTTPHVGCDEFVSSTLDLSTEALVTPEIPMALGLQDLKIRVRNTGTNPVTSFTAHYEYKNTVISQAWSGTLNPCDTTIVTFTGSNQINIDAAAVFLRIYTTDPNGLVDMAPQNDTLVTRSLKGIYTIGDTLSDYKNFASAIDALYKYGMGGDVLFNVKSGTYNEQVKVIGSRIKGITTPFKLTFQGIDADSCIITANMPTQALVILQNARNITFRGFTINNTNTFEAAGIAIVANILTDKYNGTACAVKQCKINLLAPTATGILLTTSTDGFATGACSSDSIILDSNTITGGSYGIYLSGNSNININRGFKIRNNKIVNASNCSVYLIWMYNGLDVLNNTFTGEISCNAGFSMNGLTNSGNDPLRLIGNRIEVNATSGVSLLGCFAMNPAAPTKLYNNKIINAYTGIYIHQGGSVTPPTTNYEVYHNSVSMNKVAPGTGYAFYFSNGTTLSTVLCRNNIFAITSPTGLGIPVSFFTPLGLGNLNYNNYYNSTGPVIMYKGASLTKDTYKTAIGGGDSSMNVKPEWVSSSDLRLTLGCKERGINLTTVVPRDINDSIRNIKPNLGCLEYQPNITDLAVDMITAPSYPVVAGLQDLKIRLVNNGSGMISAATISYELNGNSPVSTSWSGGLAQCDTDIVTFSNIMLGNINSLKVYISAIGDMDRTNDTLNQSISTTMFGTYTIGDTLCDYKTFALANNDLITRGIGGPIVFNVKSGVYTEQVELISAIQGVSEMNTITFQSMVLHRDSVKLQFNSTSAATNFVFRINHVSYIRLRHITFEGLNTNFAKVIELVGTSSYNTIDSCKIISKSVAGSGDRVGIYTNGLAGRNNTIKNNYLLNGASGIYWWGVSQTDITDSNVIENNRIEGVLQYGMFIQYTRNTKIRNNNISTSTSAVRALNINYTSDKLEITGNIISLTGGTGYGIALNFNTGGILTKGLIANNSISITGIVVGASAYGINSSSGTYQLYYNNSIQIASGSAASYAVYFQFSSLTSTYNELKNNILSNTKTGRALYWYAASPTNQCDYNLLYSTGAVLVERNAAYPNPLTFTNLAEWRAVTPYDKHSISYRPAFTSATNLTPNPADSAVWAINGRGIHLDSASFAIDKNGQTRPLTPATGVPDLGAYEVTPASLPPACIAVPAVMPSTLSMDSTQVFLFGSDTVAKFTWMANSTIPSSVTIRQYSGEKPPAIGTAQNYMYAYSAVNFNAPVSPVYKIQLRYNKAWLGTNTTEADVKITTKLPANSWNLDGSSGIDVVNNYLIKYSSSDNTFMITGTDVNDPLPVKLLSLTARWEKQNVAINWATASETNSNYFEVERSFDSKKFEPIGKVTAAGNSSRLRNYNLLDASLGNNTTIYYRLRMVDKDGKAEYSKTVSVKRNEVTAERVSVFPNPFTESVYVTLLSDQASDMTVKITDITGRLIREEKSTTTSGSNTVEVNTNDLVAGIYFMSIEQNGTVQVQKIMKH
jgi:hypothetical protein